MAGDAPPAVQQAVEAADKLQSSKKRCPAALRRSSVTSKMNGDTTGRYLS
jgi:hypothetical protein